MKRLSEALLCFTIIFIMYSVDAIAGAVPSEKGRRPVVAVCGSVCLRQKDGKWIQHNPESPADVQRLVDRLAANGVDRITPSLGTQYQSRFFKSPYDWDPLKTLIDAAHAKGIEVHPYQPAFMATTWFHDLPGGAKKYLSIKRDGSKDVFLSPGYEVVRRRVIDLYIELLEDYDVDGIVFDYIRFPTDPETYQASGGYDAPIMDEFKKTYGVDPLLIPDNNPNWVQFRASYITRMLREFRVEMKKRNINKPIGVFTWVGGPKHKHFGNPLETLMGTYQDNITWAREGLVDNFYTMTYTRDVVELEYQIKNLVSSLHTVNPDVNVIGAVWSTQALHKGGLGADVVIRNGANGVFFYRVDYLESMELWSEVSSVGKRLN